MPAMKRIAGLAAAFAFAAHAQAPPTHACDSPESRALDFWLGDWELTYKGEDGKPAKSRNRVTKILGGCVVLEEFSADGPQEPWAGKSLSQWIPAEHRWKQTWVDDQGGYLVHVGGVEGGAMTLYSEPRTKDGVTSQKRMVFFDVRPDAIKWRWERTIDGGATWQPEILIDYTRRK